MSIAAAILTIIAGMWLGLSAQIPWDQALPIVLAGLGILGIHPTFNTTPVAGRID